jgi:Site-specific recombinase XerD
MPSVHRHPRTVYWIAHFIGPDGRQRARSTKETDRTKAQAVAERYQREAQLLMGDSAPAPKGITLENPNAILEQFITLTQRLKAGLLTFEDAQKAMSSLLVASGQDPLRVESVRTHLEAYVQEKRMARSNSTYLRYKRVCDDFLGFLGKRADLPLATVSARDIQNFRNGELRRGVSGASANLAVTALSGAFNQAKALGVILHNPCDAVDDVGHDASERKPFSMDELRSLLKVACNEWKGMVLLGYTTGFRISDCARLRWSDVDFQRRVIVLRPKKERRDRAAKKKETVILPELEEWLLANQGVGDAPVFPTVSKKSAGGEHGASKTFRELMDKAKISYADISPEGAQRAFYDKGFHSLRHTFVSAAANAGIAPEIRREQAGHNSAVARRYEHREVEAVRASLASLPRIASTES